MLIWLVAGLDEREVQKSYWIEHSADLSVEAMMLDSKASDLDKEERPEVLFIVFNLSFFMFTLFDGFITIIEDILIFFI